MILIIDDDPSICASLTLLLKQAGYSARSVSDPSAALPCLTQGDCRLVLLDMNFSRQTSGEEGLALLKQLKTAHPALPIILMTAWGSIALAVKGMRAGASEFITKPWSNEQLLAAVRTVLELVAAQGAKQGTVDRERLDKNYDLTGLVGRDPHLLDVLDLVARVSATDAPVLITGESGTGKELVAQALHNNSSRAGAPFVKVNLGGMSVQLFESEMFGHVKGAFTDARANRVGRFEAAGKGTIFLDEIGDLESSCQVKLLRVLQDRGFEPLGSSRTLIAEARIVSATNRPLHDMVAQGVFREDLLYRLNLIAVHMPALRDRRGDIPLLANHFLARTAAIYRRENLAINDKALAWLCGLEWPGNVRQLKQMVERAVLISTGPVLELSDFQISRAAPPPPPTRLPEVGSMTLEEMERAMIANAVKVCDGNLSRVAEALGLSRAALYRRLDKFGIRP